MRRPQSQSNALPPSLDQAILQALHSAGNKAVSGAELAERLGVTRAAVWARIHELRQIGYEIVATPHIGYRLLGCPDVLHADDLLARLGPTRRIGRNIRVFRKTSSTNDVVNRLAGDGVAEGIVVFAEGQTRGRGRMGRRWFSPSSKGLWLSVLLRPAILPSESSRLTVAGAVAVARTVARHTRRAARIKWPNDILLDGRKTAGILNELHAETDVVKYVVLGVGVNVNLSLRDFPQRLRPAATSMRIAAGKRFDRAAVAVTLLRELDAVYDAILRGDFEKIAAEWRDLSCTLGREVTVEAGARRVSGRAEALDPNGGLVIRRDDGRAEALLSGTILEQR
ncbi:MAG: biotin--[acetyl-CoA-carboxylase] ligase [Verrucomicrobia bacterium]|nr:biotin--[acetyl-CoA-carboxylase] ligase [Verrucomicrobiota bacterium]